MQVIDTLEEEIAQDASSQAAGEQLKPWQGANFLLCLTFALFLSISSFIGNWGLRGVDANQLCLFPQAFVTYLFSRTMPLYWLLIGWITFLLLSCCCNWLYLDDLNFGYFLGLGLAITIIQKNKWPLWILAPIAIHLSGVLYMNLAELFINSRNLSLNEYLTLLSAFSKSSLGYEMLSVYPLAFLSIQLNKLINCFRMLE